VFDPSGQELGGFNGVSGTWWDRDIRLGGRMIAQSFPTDTYFLHSNPLQSDTQVTDHGGVVLQDQLYYPWGQMWTTGGTEVDSHFAGFQQSGSNLYGTPNRLYANPTGRWLTPDPAGKGAVHLDDPQTWNMYAYVRNNPTTLTDPSGLCTVFKEHHPWYWCAAHAVGLVTTEAERRDWLSRQNVVRVNKSGNAVSVDWKTAPVKDVNRAYGSMQPSLAETAGCALSLITCVPVLISSQGAASASLGILLPSLDGTGKVHGQLPDHVPDNWTRDEMEQLADELRQSIQTRKDAMIDLGDSASHANRIREEEQLLRQIEKKLSGS